MFKQIKQQESVEDDSLPPPKYNILHIDADTAVFRAAKSVQESYIVVKHIPTGRQIEFENKTAFYGHWKKKEGGYLGEKNKERAEKGLEPFPLEQFEIEEHDRIFDELDDPVEEAVKQFDFFIGGIKKSRLAHDYILYVGGEGNYRYGAAETLPYKGNRPEKPILFKEIRTAIVEKYKNKVKIISGREVDDQLAIVGRKNYLNWKETGEWEDILGYIDKDLKMIISPSINYDNLEDPVYTPTEYEAAFSYCTQLLIGDKQTDNIPGLPNLPNEIREKYGIRKGNSLGATTAENYLKGSDSIKELFSRVVTAYRAYYGDELFEFVNYKGDKYKCGWIERLNEVAILTYMNPLDDPLSYDIRDTLDRLGVEYRC